MKFGLAAHLFQGFIDNPDWVKAFVQTIEKAGAESVWVSEHPVVAPDHKPLYTYSRSGRPGFTPGITFPSPLEWLSYCAAVSNTLKLVTGVLLLPLHSPIIVAKRIATLDRLSKGRVILGVGLGWQIEEFESVGVPYGERGRRMDEMIPALRVLWRDSPASFAGKYYKFTNVDCDVKPVQPGGPKIMVGGSTTAAAERAARLGDAYYPYAIGPDEYASLIETLRAKAKQLGRNPAEIELTAAPAFWREGGGKSLDLGLARAYAQSGVSRLLFNSMEADSQDMKDIERFIKTYRDQIIERL